MRRFLILAQREALVLFASPLAWVLLALNWGVMGYMVTTQVIPATRGSLPLLLQQAQGIALWLQLLLTPLLTMRALAEERRSGTFEMLVTAPVRDIEIVLAKWLVVWLFSAITWLVLPLYAGLIAIAGGDPDLGPVWAGWIGVVGVAGVAAAIGLLASALARDQLVAAFLGAMAIFGFASLPQLRRLLPEGRSIAIELLSAIDVMGQGRTSAQGLVDVVDLVAMTMITAFFLLATLQVLEARKWA